MESIKEKNLRLLAANHPLIYEKINTINGDDFIDVVTTKTGESIPVVTCDGKSLYLHSRFDPVKEAVRLIGEVSVEKYDLYIIFGFGFGYHVEELIKLMSRDSILLVIEKSSAIMKKALYSRDLTTVLNDKRLIILIDPDEDLIAEKLKGKSSHTVSFITHRGCFQLDPDYYNNISGIAHSYLSTKEVNIATLAKFEKIWTSNFARNIKKFICSPGVNIFYNNFKNIPAVVVAAGPSLTRSIEFIRKNRENAIVIAVDTAYKILLHNSIEPHFCIVVDPQLINSRFFEGIHAGKTILIFDPTVHPSVFRFFQGNTAATGTAFQMLKWIELIAGDKGEITHGGSVSTNAYDFARRLGASPIILVGQDLAFTGGFAHAKGSYLDEQIHLRTNRLSNAEMFNRYQLTALPKIFVKGIKSKKVHTNQKMMIFQSWFEKRRDASLINATVDGVYIPGIKHVPCEDIRLNGIEFNLDQKIEAIFNSYNPELDPIIKKLLKKIHVMFNELDSIIPVLNRAVGLSDNLISIIGSHKRDQRKLDYILKKLSETDKIIESRDNIKNMISITIQRVIHTITEGYEIDEKDNGLNNEMLTAKRSHYLYKGILEGAQFNKKIFQKMIMILERD